jgi:alpha-1,6-mannosyltransferase
VVLLFTTLPGGSPVTRLYPRPFIDQIVLATVGVALVVGLVHVVLARRRRSRPTPEPAR